MVFFSTRSLASAALLGLFAAASASAKLTYMHPRDASTTVSGGNSTEGEDHGRIRAPSGSYFTSVPVGSKGEEIAAYWTDNPANSTATQAFIMIHGKLRNGDSYWTTMNNILTSAVNDKIAGASNDSIIVAPQFFSTRYNSGQYSDSELGWGDVNAWQAGDPATHPNGTTLTSFDALDALVDEFATAPKYPAMKNITVVGHGGGGQMIQRYAMTAKDAPSNVHIRYIHGDPSSCAYFTTDRPQSMSSGVNLPSKSSCEYWNTWRYGFVNFTGTAQGLLSPQDYFKQYISRDVISIVGYQDTGNDGDQYCMARIQGGVARRDRNLAWWRYINTLARTNEDLTGFPATFGNLPDWSNISGNAISMQLIVVEAADHDAELVFGSDEGHASLFSSGQMPTGWRPAGWTAATSSSSSNSTKKGTSASSSGGSSSGSSSYKAFSSVTALVVAALFASYTLLL